MVRIKEWSWKNDCKWRRWIPIMVFAYYCSNNKVIFPTKHQHGMANDKKWCEMSWILQLCLRFDNRHTTSFWQTTANCDVSGKALSTTLSGTHPKPNSSTSFTGSKMLGTGNCSVDEKCQSGLRVLRLWIWVLQPNKWCKACESLICSCRLLTAVPWALTVHGIWIVVLAWQGNAKTTPSCQQTV